MKTTLLSHEAGEGPSILTVGVTDLMTSLAVIFILLFTAYVTKTSESESQAQEIKEDITSVLRDHFHRYRLSLDADPSDPMVLRVVVPEELLNFEYGKGTLSQVARQFLADSMPTYASVLCGPLREKIDSLVIEGHTDDRGSDFHNLKLSQDRSFSVMAKGLEVIAEAVPWAYSCFYQKTSASGRGRQDLVYEGANVLNRDKSRRVIFKIRLRSA